MIRLSTPNSDRVTYELALKLKEMGFNEECNAYYRDLLGTTEKIFFSSEYQIKNNQCTKSIHNMLAAPTYDQAMKWLFKNNKLPKSSFIHPELQENETYIMNVTQKELELGLWENSPIFEDLRVGNVAYTTNGTEIVENYFPLFGKARK